MTRVIVGDFRTGRKWKDLPVLDATWERRRNTAETITAKVTLRDRDVRALGLRNAAAPGKAFLAVLEGDTFMGAGPIWRKTWLDDEGTLSLRAAGMWSWADHRSILPATALTAETSSFLVADPADATKTMPNPALRTALSNLSYGSIVKRWLAQAMSWPGGAVPLVLPADEPGTRRREAIEGTDFKNLGDAISDITEVENGPDVLFQPRWTEDRLGIEWVLQTGTETQPQIRSASLHRWDLGLAESSMSGLTVIEDASNVASVAWVTGGRTADTALVQRAVSPRLTDAGYPLLERVDSSHTSVSEPPTLAMYAAEIVRVNDRPGEQWSFKVKKGMAPRIGEYNIGDRVQLHVRNNLYIPDSPPGGYVREISGLSGNLGADVTVTTAEVFGG